MEQKTGFTETGKRVILKDDGAWEYSDPSAGGAPTDFRRTTWGMSRAQVRNLEKAELLKDGKEGLVYSGKVSNYPCFIAYYFIQDRLVRARYNITEEHDYPSEYIAGFQKLHGVLETKYGTPSRSERKWSNDLYREDEESWGKAVALGHLIIWSSWETETTEISLMLRGEDQLILLEIEYSSKALADLEEQGDAASELDDF